MEKYLEVFEDKKSLRERLGDIRNIKKKLMKKVPSIGNFDNYESSNKLNKSVMHKKFKNSNRNINITTKPKTQVNTFGKL